MRYFLELAYRGADYHGWQSQPNAVSVQQTIEEALGVIMRRPVPIVGAGRTDAGVNARTMFAHFDTDVVIADKRRWLLSLNRLCGRDIAIRDVRPVCEDAHARFDARRRVYKYFVTEEKSPFLYPLAWQATSPLDYDAMNSAARLLLDTSDFTSFAKLHTDVKTNICRVDTAIWEELTPGVRVFTIAADRFLRNMVRAVVGTLVDVGRGKLSVNGFADIIAARNRCSAGTSMPPQALYLWNVEYPDEIFL